MSRMLETHKLQLKKQTLDVKFWLLKTGLIDDAIRSGYWEPLTTWAMERYIRYTQTHKKREAVVFDIGANIGYYTILSGLLGAKVVAFEAMSEPAKVVQDNIDANNLRDSCSVVRALVGSADSDGLLTYTNFLWPPPALSAKVPETVPCVAIDTFCKSFPAPHIIKIDTDGYDFDVLEGALNTLRDHHPIIELEVCEYTLREIRTSKPSSGKGKYPYCQDMLSFLAGLGYAFLLEDTLSPTTIEAALDTTDLNGFSMNLICV
jgi:FkbM family methyltransferase